MRQKGTQTFFLQATYTLIITRTRLSEVIYIILIRKHPVNAEQIKRWTGFRELPYSWCMKKWPAEIREAAALFGRMGGTAAGKKMTKEARIARAKKAARARWARVGKRDTSLKNR